MDYGHSFRQGHPKGVACEPLTATAKETLIYAQGGAKTHWEKRPIASSSSHPTKTPQISQTHISRPNN